MFGNNEDIKPEEAFKLLEELQLNQPSTVIESKESGEAGVTIGLTIETGNASQKTTTALEGVSSKLSKLQVVLLANEPLLVGDVYRVEFDASMLNAGKVYALCRRCQMLNDEQFQISLRFLTPLDLSAANF